MAVEFILWRVAEVAVHIPLKRGQGEEFSLMSCPEIGLHKK
jgi:hypothetical protein